MKKKDGIYYNIQNSQGLSVGLINFGRKYAYCTSKCLLKLNSSNDAIKLFEAMKCTSLVAYHYENGKLMSSTTLKKK